MSIIAYVGIDAHEKSHRIGVLLEGSEKPFPTMLVANEEREVKRFFVKLKSEYDVRCCYEASGIGYVLQRWLSQIGISCEVIAPSLIPQRSGDRIKTDKRDALKLARLYRAGQLTPIHVPSVQEEAVRNLVRLRDALVRDVVESKNLVNKFLSVHGRHFPGKSRWTQKHWVWLRQQCFAAPEDFAWAEYLGLLEFKQSRLAEVDRRIEAYAVSDLYKDQVRRLCCLRGIGTVTAMTLVTEIIDFRRFPSARSLMSYLGLVPKENSSGERRRQSGITKTGNSRCRRVLVEAAWKYKHKPVLSLALKQRQEGMAAALTAHSWKAQRRLYEKFWSIANRKENAKAVVAVARELTGFVWAIMVTPVATA